MLLTVLSAVHECYVGAHCFTDDNDCQRLPTLNHPYLAVCVGLLLCIECKFLCQLTTDFYILTASCWFQELVLQRTLQIAEERLHHLKHSDAADARALVLLLTSQQQVCALVDGYPADMHPADGYPGLAIVRRAHLISSPGVCIVFFFVGQFSN